MMKVKTHIDTLYTTRYGRPHTVFEKGKKMKENKHSAYELKQMQSLPLEAKITMTKQRIKHWYESWSRYEIVNEKTGKSRFVTMDTRDPFAEPTLTKNEWIRSVIPGQVYVTFSGGKDSTVLKHIVDSMYYDVPALFVNTGLEYPEIQHFVREVKNGKYDCFNHDIEIMRPEMQFKDVLTEYGYPVIGKEVAKNVYYARKSGKENVHYKKLFGLYEHKGKKSQFCTDKYSFLYDAPFLVSDRCCDVMKKTPARKYGKETGRKPIIGTMASESRIRKSSWIKNGCNAFDNKKPSSQPLSFWTQQDILRYIKKYDVPYCTVYGDIIVDESADDVLDGQINIFDELGYYETAGKLKTTGCDRTGCIFCMFGSHLEKEPNRFQRLKETHPRQYDYCINGGEMVDGKWQPNKDGLGLGKVLDYIGVPYE